MNNKLVLQAMALDLKRAAIGYNSGSIRMADIFLRECFNKLNKVDISSISAQLKALLKRIEELKVEQDQQKLSEYLLTYSTILLSLTK